MGKRRNGKIHENFTTHPRPAVVRVFNDNIIRAREKCGMTLQELAKKAGMRPNDVCALQRFDYTISRAEDKAARLAAALGIFFDEVMPEGSAGKKIQSSFTRIAEADIKRLLADRLAPPAMNKLESEDLASAVSLAMECLGPREKTIIEKRFGLGCDAMTLEEIGVFFKITTERVRQIELRALRDLHQHRLAEFLPGVE